MEHNEGLTTLMNLGVFKLSLEVSEAAPQWIDMIITLTASSEQRSVVAL